MTSAAVFALSVGAAVAAVSGAPDATVSVLPQSVIVYTDETPAADNAYILLKQYPNRTVTNIFLKSGETLLPLTALFQPLYADLNGDMILKYTDTLDFDRFPA